MLATGSLDTTVKLWETEYRPGAGLPPGTRATASRPWPSPRRPDRWRRAASTARCASGSPRPRSSRRRPASPTPARPAAWPSRPTADRSARPATAGIARWDVLTGSPITPTARTGATALAAAPDGRSYAVGIAGRRGPPVRCRFRPCDSPRSEGTPAPCGRLPSRPTPGSSPRETGTGSSISGMRSAAGSWVRSRPRTGRSPASGSRPTAARSPWRPATRTKSSTGAVILWDVATRRERRHAAVARARGVASVAFSPDGTTIATAGSDGVVRLWDVATRSAAKRPEICRLPSVAFSPDGRYARLGASERRRGPLGCPERPAARPAEGAPRSGHRGRLLARRPFRSPRPARTGRSSSGT